MIVRGLAALSVVVWHAQGYLGKFPAVLNMPGRTAVWLFFGISGYVIAYGFIHYRYKMSAHDIKDFYINRFLRIYPLFFTVSIISWFIAVFFVGKNPIEFVDIPAQLFALQFNHNYVLNSVFWTLGIEIQFYFLAPILVFPLLTQQTKVSLVTGFIAYAVILLGYRFAIINFDWSVDGRNIISNLPHFFIGMVGCRMAASLKPDKRRFYITLVCACILLMYTSWMYHNASRQYWSGQGILLVDACILLFIIAHASFNQEKFSTNFTYKTFAFFGTISYGIYALHTLIIKYVPNISNQLIGLIVATTVSAYILYRVIELPALKLKRKHIKNFT